MLIITATIGVIFLIMWIEWRRLSAKERRQQAFEQRIEDECRRISPKNIENPRDDIQEHGEM